MQIGDSLFDIQRGILTNQLTGEQWQLPRAERQVLTLLVVNIDKVVAKQTLGAGDNEHPPLSDSSVTRAIFMLRSFLGPLHEHMIETIKGKGYRLHIDKRLSKPVTKATTGRVKQTYQAVILWLFGKRNRALKAWIGILILLLTILVLRQWRVSVDDDVQHTPAFASTSVTLKSGQQLNLLSYAKSKTNNTLLLLLAERLAQEFGHCDTTPWKNVYLSLSHDKQVFNITLKGDKFGQSVVRNLKLTDFRQQKNFISEQWFTEVSLCE
ncbi:helix-turn-helix domain-containing protein [Shewanella aestuarii]|uniref:Helix-turn-helix domain-containing protein n=1 Tax=Shewanella aestuarii TaxID=1028752 RepID=A0A6G9QNT8_9GAMM|nr:helix-turn-helix domain-containing protein [Shewanella aestuarii]